MLGFAIVAVLSGIPALLEIVGGVDLGIQPGILSVIFFVSTGMLLILSGIIFLVIPLVGAMFIIMGIILLIIGLRAGIS